MPARGKPGKPRAGFPPFPQSLESPQTRRPSHIPPASTANTYIGEKEASTASRPGLKPSHSRVGQNKLPKWAKIRLFRSFDAAQGEAPAALADEYGKTRARSSSKPARP